MFVVQPAFYPRNKRIAAKLALSGTGGKLDGIKIVRVSNQIDTFPSALEQNNF